MPSVLSKRSTQSKILHIGSLPKGWIREKLYNLFGSDQLCYFDEPGGKKQWRNNVDISWSVFEFL